MGNTHNESRDRPLRVGLISTLEDLPRLADALARPGIAVVAQAGMAQSGALPRAEWFDDTRVLIAQSAIDALFLNTSARVGAELARSAVGRGIHVWRSAPLGRSFGEAAEDFAAVRAAPVAYRVASWWDHIAADVRWAFGLQDSFKPLFSTIRVAANGPGVQSWRSSIVDSGGGVLANDGYAALEALIAIRKLPTRVTASTGRCRRRIGAAPRETEDIAVATLQYDEGGLALFEATWDIEPFGDAGFHHGAEATMEISNSRVAVRLADGTLLDERRLTSPQAAMAAEVTLFEAAVRASAGAHRDERTLERHLATTALIDTLYLAARTGQPETPRKLYDVLGWPEPNL